MQLVLIVEVLLVFTSSPKGIGCPSQLATTRLLPTGGMVGFKQATCWYWVGGWILKMFQWNDTQSQTGNSGAEDQVLFHWQVMFHHWICSPVPSDTKRLAAPHSYLKYVKTPNNIQQFTAELHCSCEGYLVVERVPSTKQNSLHQMDMRSWLQRLGPAEWVGDVGC